MDARNQQASAPAKGRPEELAEYLDTCRRTSSHPHFVTLNNLKAIEVSRFLRGYARLVDALLHQQMEETMLADRALDKEVAAYARARADKCGALLRQLDEETKEVIK